MFIHTVPPLWSTPPEAIILQCECMFIHTVPLWSTPPEANVKANPAVFTSDSYVDLQIYLVVMCVCGGNVRMSHNIISCMVPSSIVGTSHTLHQLHSCLCG